MKTDETMDFMGDEVPVYICDFCGVKCDDGRACRKNPKTGITICQCCITDFANQIGYFPPRQFLPSDPNKVTIPEPLRWEIFERDNFTCQKCGSRRLLTIDHIIPKSKGGLTVKDNLQTLCKACNIKKGKKLEASRRSNG